MHKQCTPWLQLYHARHVTLRQQLLQQHQALRYIRQRHIDHLAVKVSHTHTAAGGTCAG
jgi:hypothetical protein